MGPSDKRSVAVLGSTGSVGRLAVEVARTCGVRVRGLAGGSDLELLARQAVECASQWVCVRTPDQVGPLRRHLAGRDPQKCCSV